MDLWLWDDGAGGGEPPDWLRAGLTQAGVALAAHVVDARGHASAPAGQPLLLWQGRDDPLARARALAAGADEIVGPWMTREEALARLLRFHARPRGTETSLRLGPLEIDLIGHAAARDGRMLRLLHREYELLLHLARHAGAIQSREALLRAIWRLAFDPGTNVVEVHVSRLRAKLDRGYPWPMLRTVRGAGYALVAEAATA